MMPNFDSPYGRFLQISYVTRDIDTAVAGLERRMGAKLLDFVRDLRSETGVPSMIEHISHLSMPGVELEVIQPRMDIPSVYHWPAVKGAELRLHHFGYLLPDEAAWERAVARVDDQETLVALRLELKDFRVIYLDTRAQHGHYTELVLRKPSYSGRPIPS